MFLFEFISLKIRNSVDKLINNIINVVNENNCIYVLILIDKIFTLV